MAEKIRVWRVTDVNGSKTIIHPETTASQVIEEDEKQFITATEKAQISTNKTNINTLTTNFNSYKTSNDSKNSSQDTTIGSNTNRIKALEDTVGTDGTSGTLVDRVSDLEDFVDTKGVANGLATLNANGKVPETQLPDSVLGQLSYKGTWNANTNKFASWVDYGDPSGTTTMTSYQLSSMETSITLPSEYDKNTGYIDTTNKVYYPAIGDYFIVATAGTYNSVSYEVGDWIIFNGQGQGYAKVDNTDAVSSVAGLTGNVSVPNLKPALGIDKVNNTADADKEVKSATQLKNTKTFNVSGDVTGTAQNFNGTQNVVIPTTLSDDAVTGTKIKDGAVTEGKIEDGAVTTDKLGATSVTSDKLGTNAVTTAKINNGAVTADKLSTDAVTSAKIKDGAVTEAKLETLHTGGTFSAVSVDTKGRVTAGGNLIEFGGSGQTSPSDSLAVGGLFFELVE